MQRTGSGAAAAAGAGGFGVNILDDTLGCRCSFKLPSNSQLCRIFVVVTAMIVLLNSGFFCGFFFCYGGTFLGGGRGISTVLHSVGTGALCSHPHSSTAT